MNYKQIADLSNKRNVWFEVLEDYTYHSDFETETITKGTKMQLTNQFISSWHFKFEIPQKGFLGISIGFGRSRLLKLKLKELKEAEED